MHNLKIFQANLRKSPESQHSVLNDTDLSDFHMLLIQEPHCHTFFDQPFITEQYSRHWDLFHPSVFSETRYPYRSAIWAKKSLSVKQITLESSDITALQINHPESVILAFSIYIPNESILSPRSRQLLLNGST